VVVVGYAASFYFLSLTLRTIPVGVAYAVWSGVGLALASVIGYLVYRQTLDVPALIGMALIALGAAVICFFSKSVAHSCHCAQRDACAERAIYVPMPVLLLEIPQAL
jgi:small multidrug resistance pump